MKSPSIINHLDNLKLYLKNDKELEGLFFAVKQFIADIRMEFRLDKCAKATFRKGKLIRTNAVELDIDKTNCELLQSAKEIWDSAKEIWDSTKEMEYIIVR